jgi:predicted AlkP superfamily phosphohydrolase/phosphomutase
VKRALATLLIGLTACARASDPADFRARPERPLLVVGWDGATWKVADPLLDAGRLPALAELVRRGASAELESTVIPISSAAWAAATTGKGPGETGVFGFFAPVEGSYDQRLISALDNRATPLWRLLTSRGLRSHVFGVPVTYPPEPVFGTFVGGMLSPDEADYAWPSGTAEALRARGFVPDLEPWLVHKDMSWGELERHLDSSADFMVEQLARRDWDLAWIVFKDSDVVGHRAYEEDFQSFVAPVYARLDGILARLLEAAGPDVNVMLLSDHGFTTYARGFNLHAWLIQEGFAIAREGTRTPVPADLPFGERFRQEQRARLDDLDLARTRAYAHSCEGNFGSLRLNLAGREPEGPVAREDAGGTRDQIARRLAELPFVVRTWNAEELHPGAERGALPDLLFEVAPDVQVFAEPGPTVSGAYPRPVPDHDLHGLLVLAGPDVRAVEGRGRAHLLDVFPTALHLLAQPVYRELRGEVLTRWLAPGRAIVRVGARDDPALARVPHDGASPFTPAQLSDLERRLRALGYD